MLTMSGNSRGTVSGDVKKVAKNLFYTTKKYKDLGIIEKSFTMKQCMAICYKVEETKKPFQTLETYKIEWVED